MPDTSPEGRTVQLSGGLYVPVDEKIRLVHEKYGGYDVVSQRNYEMRGRQFYEIILDINGNRYVGTAEIKIGGRGVDATSPYENGETSAIGRALQHAGIGIVSQNQKAFHALTADPSSIRTNHVPSRPTATTPVAVTMANSPSWENLRDLLVKKHRWSEYQASTAVRAYLQEAKKNMSKLEDSEWLAMWQHFDDANLERPQQPS